MLRWSLTDLHCEEVGVFDQRLPGSNVVRPLSSRRTARLVVSLEEELAHQVEPLKTGLYVEYMGKEYFHGPCLDPVLDGEQGTCEIAAVDASEWAARGFHHSDFDRSQEQVQTAWDSIAQRMVDWDPNQQVLLARIIKGNLVPTGMSRVTHSDTGVATFKTLEDLYQFFDGVEWELEPLRPGDYYDRGDAVQLVWSPDGPPAGYRTDRCAAWARLNVQQRFGSDKSDDVRFEYKFGLENAQNLTLNPLGSTVRNYENARGQADGSVQPTGFSRNLDSVRDRGSWEGWDSTSYTDDQTVLAFARQQVAGYAKPVEKFKVVPAMEWMEREGEKPYGFPPTFGEEYDVGDTISAAAQLGAVKYEVEGRVTQATLTEVDSHANVRVDIECVPRVVASGVT